MIAMKSKVKLQNIMNSVHEIYLISEKIPTKYLFIGKKLINIWNPIISL